MDGVEPWKKLAPSQSRGVAKKWIVGKLKWGAGTPKHHWNDTKMPPKHFLAMDYCSLYLWNILPLHFH